MLNYQRVHPISGLLDHQKFPPPFLPQVLIAAHGNSLRALVKILDNVPEGRGAWEHGWGKTSLKMLDDFEPGFWMMLDDVG